MKILHSADWHLDSPMSGHESHRRQYLQEALQQIPKKLLEICRREQVDLVLLSGDLFDGAYSQSSYQSVYHCLQKMAVPVFITPGNHDFISPDSPWIRESWPENVHIFKKNQVESVALPQLDCRVYGAAFTQADCPPLLENFQVQGKETYQLGVFHADPTLARSPYNPITRQQVENSGLDYLALGHIHKGDSFRAGKTLCLWPGCPMGTGYDEDGVKGVVIADVAEETSARFLPLDLPRFYDLTLTPRQQLQQVLPAVANSDFYRVTFTGEREKPDLESLYQQFAGFSNLLLRDETTAPVDLWAGAGEDSFEGLYFGLLKQQLDQSPQQQETIELAAKLSRQILAGEEVVLP